MTDETKDTPEPTPEKKETVAPRGKKTRWEKLGLQGVGHLTTTPDGKDFRVVERGVVEFPTLHDHPETHNVKLLNMMPAMMTTATRILMAIGQKKPVRAAYVEGYPGQGKSKLGEVIASAMGAKKYRIDCGDRLTSELLCDITVGGQEGQTIFQELNNKLAELSRDDQFVKLVGALLKRQGAREALIVPEAESEAEGHHPYVETSTIDEEKLFDVAKALSDNASLLGLSLKVNRNANVVKKNGELLQALIDLLDLEQPDPAKRHTKPGMIVMDEYSRRLDDGGALQQLYEVLGGTNKVASVRGENNRVYEITNKQLADAGVFVLFTANPYDPIRDPKSKNIPPAVEDRIGRTTCRTAGAEDFQYLMEILLTGVPISGLHAVKKPNCNEKEFPDLVQRVHAIGLDKSIRPETAHAQRLLLSNYDNVMQACQQIGEFLEEWRKVEMLECETTDKETKDYRNNTGRNEIPITLRMVQKLADEAGYDHFEMKEHASDAEHQHDQKPYVEKLGTNMVAAIHELIDRHYHDRPIAKEYLKSRAKHLGIYNPDNLENDIPLMSDVQGTGGGKRSITKLLDMTPDMKVTDEVRAWQKELLKVLLQRYPEHFNYRVEQDGDIVSKESNSKLNHKEVQELADTVLPPQKLQDAIQSLEPDARSKAGIFSNATSIGRLPTLELVVNSGASGQLEVNVIAAPTVLVDPHAVVRSGEDRIWHGMGNLETEEIRAAIKRTNDKANAVVSPSLTELLMTLSAEGGMQAARRALFTQGYSNAHPEQRNDEPVRMMENRSETGIGITTFQLRKPQAFNAEGKPSEKPKRELVHVISFEDEMLVVSDEKINPALEVHLKRAHNIQYFSRAQRGTEQALAIELIRLSEKAADTYNDKYQDEDAKRPLESIQGDMLSAFQKSNRPSETLRALQERKLAHKAENAIDTDEELAAALLRGDSQEIPAMGPHGYPDLVSIDVLAKQMSDQSNTSSIRAGEIYNIKFSKRANLGAPTDSKGVSL